jgi:sporulation protein YlmC with PRC-barrel domain
MLRKMQDLVGFRIRAADGHIGRVQDLYFDDQQWTVRYLGVSIGTWFSDRQVLLSSALIKEPDWSGDALRVLLTKKQIEKSPTIPGHRALTNLDDQEDGNKRQWSASWPQNRALSPAVNKLNAGLLATATAPLAWPAETTGAQHMHVRNCGQLGAYGRLPGAPHLHSAHAMLHDTIQAIDGELGYVEDLLINEADWRIHHLLVGTRNCWPDRQVLVSPHWIKPANWLESQVVVNRTYAQIQNNPELIIQK